MEFTDAEKRMLRELLRGHLTNLEGHREAIRTLPELAGLADEGYAELDAQVDVATSILAKL